MMGRVGNRFRTQWTALLHGELEAVRADLTTSWTSSLDELRKDVVAEREVAATRIAEHDLELVTALHRVAEAFERIAENLESDRRERGTQLDAVEFLLREMVIGYAQPTAIAPVVLGGTIDATSLDAKRNAKVDIDLSEAPIPVGVFVEVRSRFHDHWVHGFAIAEYIPGPTRRGYRLRRLTDTEQLPLLFDASDVRRATVPTDHPVVDQTVEPEPSMWR